MTSHCDVVIIGGGAIGSSIAYQLAGAGSNVTIVERDSIGSHASGFALGLLNPTSETGNSEALSHQSFHMHREMLDLVQEESGVDVQVLEMPHIEVALTEESIPGLQAENERIAQLPGFASTWLGPDQIRSLEPRLTEDLNGGLLVEDVIIVDSYKFTLATALAAEARGTVLVQGEATGIAYEHDRLVGVYVGEDLINCDVLVLAPGPWAGTASLWLDIDVPVVPQKGEIIRIGSLDPPLDYHIHGYHLESSCSVVQKADGATWLAATKQDGVGFNTVPSSEAKELLSLQGVRIIPQFESHPLILHTACTRPVTPDGDPILGKVPGREGVFIATGTGGQGILLAPVIGRAIADLVMTGETGIDIRQFGLDRFSTG